MSPRELLAFQKNLLEWFAEHQRPLPWRKNYDPYSVWVSEMMLQQTQVATVLPYFKRWMETLPTLQAVANAPEEQVLKLWEGLGYYSRARNLQKAAKHIVEDHQGVFPSKFETILSLPGVGRYTAGAIGSIAFNQNTPIVDGNVTRVLCRLMDLRGEPKSASMVKTLWHYAEAWIPQGQARFFNQGLMELGATLCLPQKPGCLLCPVQNFCQSFQAGSVARVPAKTVRRPRTPITTALAVIENDHQFLIQKRPVGGLMGGLWEFPNVNLEEGQAMKETLRQEIEKQYHLEISIEAAITTIGHGYTSFKVTLHCFLCRCVEGSRKKLRPSARWVSLEELEQFSFPAAHKKLIRILQNQKAFS